MSNLWDEALTSVNTYAAAVGEAGEGETAPLETSVTLAVFDAQDGLQYDVLRESVAPTDWQSVTSDEVSPRGMTPLFDAIGRIISTAESDNPEKAVIVIMTDGLENSSREITREGARAALDRGKSCFSALISGSSTTPKPSASRRRRPWRSARARWKSP